MPLADSKPKTTRSASKKAEPVSSPGRSPRGVDTSGAWVLLGDVCFLTHTVSHRADGNIIVGIPGGDPEQQAALRALRPEGYRHSGQVRYAYQNEAAQVQVQSVEAESIAGKTTFIVTLKPDTRGQSGHMAEVSTTTHSADDIACLWARQLLLNEEPNSGGKDSTLALVMGSFGSSRRGTENLPDLWARLSRQSKNFLPQARLWAVYYLVTDGIVEHVLELRLGPMKQNGLAVRFRGRRKQIYANHSPAVIEVEGICPLRPTA